MRISPDVESRFLKTLIDRANRLNPKMIVPILSEKPFHLAGGALMPGTPNDYDLYPNGYSFDREAIKRAIGNNPKAKVVFETENALTAMIDGQRVQFCNYSKPSLKELCDSFDFAHCQVGVTFSAIIGVDDKVSYSVEDVYVSEKWVTAKLQESTFYAGSEYPLSALLRVVKYANRGLFNGKSYYASIFKCLSDIVQRGYSDRDDFKRQLESIDLGITDDGSMDWLYHDLEVGGLIREDRRPRMAAPTPTPTAPVPLSPDDYPF